MSLFIDRFGEDQLWYVLDDADHDAQVAGPFKTFFDATLAKQNLAPRTGHWDFRAWVRVPGTANDQKGALKVAEAFAEEASKGEAGGVSIDDNEPIFEEDA